MPMPVAETVWMRKRGKSSTPFMKKLSTQGRPFLLSSLRSVVGSSPSVTNGRVGSLIWDLRFRSHIRGMKTTAVSSVTNLDSMWHLKPRNQHFKPRNQHLKPRNQHLKPRNQPLFLWRSFSVTSPMFLVCTDRWNLPPPASPKLPNPPTCVPPVLTRNSSGCANAEVLYRTCGSRTGEFHPGFLGLGISPGRPSSAVSGASVTAWPGRVCSKRHIDRAGACGTGATRAGAAALLPWSQAEGIWTGWWTVARLLTRENESFRSFPFCGARVNDSRIAPKHISL